MDRLGVPGRPARQLIQAPGGPLQRMNRQPSGMASVEGVARTAAQVGNATSTIGYSQNRLNCAQPPAQAFQFPSAYSRRSGARHHRMPVMECDWRSLPGGVISA